MKAFLVPWVQQQLRISNVAANLNSVAPSYNGTPDASSTWSDLVQIVVPRMLHP